jgi:uncharacterized membrane protein
VSYEQIISDVSRAVEVAGIATLVIGGVYALGTFMVRVARGGRADSYEELRRSLGRSILLGLEILVAADIIRTIAITPTFASVGVLGLIVVVRTFLSFSLEAELDGQWPWRKTADQRSQRSRAQEVPDTRATDGAGADGSTWRALGERERTLEPSSRHSNGALSKPNRP